jgi:L-Lysine epsilon oxidase N-terminal/L-lysine epsilon oxidase C-terminal domain
MSNLVYEIFPSIGIARVGNAPESFYIGPERAGGLPILPDEPARPFGASDFRDSEGRLRRQAARFRIWRSGPCATPEEVTLDTKDVRKIRWNVHVANKKASWYRFLNTRGQYGYASNHPLRNAEVQTPGDRRQLMIDPGPRSIAGRDAGGPAAPVEFSRATIPPGYQGGNFPAAMLRPSAIDTLGRIRTDGCGRLLVLGGFGHGGSLQETPALSDYANNDGWWDDISDGPVRATIELAGGQLIEAKPAWVLVGPPAYAPQISNLVTLYDAMFDTAVRYLDSRPDIYAQGLWRGGAQGYRPRFETEIRPIFEHGSGYPWVADIPPAPHSFDFAQLADPNPGLGETRKFYLDILRGPGEENTFDSSVTATGMMPLLVGDDVRGAEKDAGAMLATSKFLRLTETQYFFLQQWAAGYFVVNGTPEMHPGKVLTRAVLDNCVGGALSPGIEMGWIARNPTIYAEPFRIRVRPAVGGPLSLGYNFANGLEPGDLTRYMALPWQADFNECSTQKISGRALWWWPAQRPVSVYLPAEMKAGVAMMPAGSLGHQVPWVGGDDDLTTPDHLAFANNVKMLSSWDKLGFLLDVGKSGSSRFVEVARTLPRAAPKAK